MAAAPKYKVFNKTNDYRASFKDPSEAASFLAVLACGSIRLGHAKAAIVYCTDLDGPIESYDDVGHIVMKRERERLEKALQ